jgi:autotransporter translocation and assembly factor TamB
LKLTINVKAKKEFGKTLRMLGKVEDINGRVEQAPKFFTVIDSNIVFQGRKEINPLLDLKVEHELPDILITINIYGNAKRPKLTFSSEPPLPKKDILSYLLLGVSTAGLGEGQGSLGREAQLFIMNQAARDLAYEMELDRVFVKDDGTGEGYAVQVGKKFHEDTMVILEYSKEGNSFIIEYDVSKNIKLEVGHHQKTIPSQSIDIYFRKRFK